MIVDLLGLRCPDTLRHHVRVSVIMHMGAWDDVRLRALAGSRRVDPMVGAARAELARREALS